jgi:FKBP-type peptidyl-prolyl cis-trans isomerase FkpA/FKBP-type peptidyl-prolyl cis-trans isomerase FklB
MNRKIIKSSILLFLLPVLGTTMALDMDSEAQKLSYMFGLDIGRSIAQQGEEIDLDVLIEALRVGFSGDESEMTEEQITQVRNAFMQRRQAALQEQQAALQEASVAEMSDNKAAGAAFLAGNQEQEGIVQTSSGLQYQVESEGGGAHPAATDTVTVHYRGTLLDGSEFDSSYARNQPISFKLDQVIPGWTEGLQLMAAGAKYKFYIPSDLAYGDQGRPPTIPPAAMLIFDIELIEFSSE